jgi:large subunit ribosomal protein L17
MKHKIGFNRLSRTPSHRKSLHRNMVTSLFRHERVKTTKAKAQAVRRTAEKLITRAKEDSVHNRRLAGRLIEDQAVLAKLFTELGPRYKSRPGGYTRILKLGPRPGDAAEVVVLELVERIEVKKEPKAKKPKEKAAEPEKTEVEAEA